MAKSKSTVGEPSLAYNDMATKWSMLHALLGGTFAMREAGSTWLPQEPKEKTEAFAVRLARSFLYNGFGRAIERIVSKPFSKPITISGVLPERLNGLKQDADRSGTSLTHLAREVFEAGITYGLSHLLVDYPQAAEQATLEDEQRNDLRPAFIHITPPDMIGWRAERTGSGRRRLTEIRFCETRVEVDEATGKETQVEYIRLYTTTGWELWRYDVAAKDFIKEEEGVHTFGGVPLVTYYAKRTGFMTGTPPLEDLAHLNIAHWQSSSDQRNILRFVRAGILLATGFKSSELEEVIISPQQVIRSVNADAEVRYVEHTGHAVEAGANDIRRLEEQMEVLGMQPFMERTTRSTATAKIIDEASTESSVQAWIRSLEDVLLLAFNVAGQWINVEIPADVTLDIFNDFSIAIRKQDDIERLLKMRAAIPPLITHKTFLREVKRRGVLSERLDIDAEIASVESESPVPGFDSSGTGEEGEEEE